MKHKNLLAAAYLGVLALFTGYVMLDTFVIPTAVTTDAAAINTEMFADEQTGMSDGGVTAEKALGSDAETTDPDKMKHPSFDDTDGFERKRPPDFPKHDSFDEGDENMEHGSFRHPFPTPSERSGSGEGSEEKIVTSESSDGKTYEDENISIRISEYYENDTRIYVADVKLSSAQYLKTALANDSYGKNITAATSDIAASKNAVFAVNGDYYGARESGYVIRNGVIYRDKGSEDTDVLCIYTDGHFEITNSGEKTAEQLLADGVWQAFSFGPALIEDGSITVTEKDEVGKGMQSNPRTAIGIIDDLHYVFVVSDGRTSESAGLTLKELADFMQKLGAKTAYNLDGGGSSTMYFDGMVINNPTTSGNNISERKVSDIVYIK